MSSMVLLLLSGVGLLVSFSESMLIPALPTIQLQYEASAAAASWIPAIYLLVGAVSVPLLGKWGDTYGKKRLLMIVMAAYSGAVVLDGFSWDLASLLAFRAVQGLGLAMFPLAISLIHDEMEAARVPVSIGVLTSMNGVGSAIGLILGAWITENYGWQTNYHVLAPFAVLLTVILWFAVRESTQRHAERIDYVGISFLGASVALLLVAVTEGGTLGWTSATTLTLVVFGLGFALALIVAERRSARPLFQLKAPGFANILKVDFAMFVAGAVMFLGFYVAIYFAQEPTVGLGRDVAQAGLVLAPAAILMLVFAPLGGRIAQRFGEKPVELLGFLLVVAGFVSLIFLHKTAFGLGLDMVVLFAGVAFLLTALSISVLALAPANDVGSEIGLNTSFRTIGQALGVAVAGACLTAYVIPGTSLPSDTAYYLTALTGIGLAVLGALLVLTLPHPPVGNKTAADTA
ncbi:MAG: MFS transporter [Thermoplasmata archaeon]